MHSDKLLTLGTNSTVKFAKPILHFWNGCFDFSEIQIWPIATINTL